MSDPVYPDTVPNLARLERPKLWWFRLLAALCSGGLLALTFPPCSCTWLLPFALLPVLLVPTPRVVWQRLLTGYLFGYCHYAISLYWLNEVGFGAGWILAAACACYPMVWYLILAAWNWQYKDYHVAFSPGAGPLFFHSNVRMTRFAVFAAALWCTLEYLRGVFFTGFPWNRLGVSLYQHPSLIQICAWTGIGGLTFVILLWNCIFAGEIAKRIRHHFCPVPRYQIPWHFYLGLLALMPVFMLCSSGSQEQRTPAPQDSRILRLGAIQGNIPECRECTEAQLQEAMTVYDTLTRKLAEKDGKIDLFLWPECAIPAPWNYQPFSVMRLKLMQTLQKPLLLGALFYRRLNPQGQEAQPSTADIHLFNSAALLAENNQVTAIYDKQHRVPFGEYTPMGDIFPKLREYLGMGRDLTPGKGAVLFPFPKGVRAGVNICFEDVFPQISREFTREGADLLVTITNDSWYRESSGSRQHLSQMVFRAVENHRPFLRVGNNAHSCFVDAYGHIQGIPTDPHTKSEFLQASPVYEIPIPESKRITFYTRYGEWFSWLCMLYSLGECLWLLWAKMCRHRRNLAAIEQ